jgi:hypothetical protein
MPFKLTSASLALALIFATPVFAQPENSSPACNKTKADMAHSPSSTGQSANSMADTSSGSGMTGTGASSAAIGTGPTDKTGVMSPCVPGVAGHTTGALPNSPPNTP